MLGHGRHVGSRHISNNPFYGDSMKKPVGRMPPAYFFLFYNVTSHVILIVHWPHVSFAIHSHPCGCVKLSAACSATCSRSHSCFVTL